MAYKFTVMWACEIVAENVEDAALVARRTIANAPYSCFDVYAGDYSDQPYTVEVLNDGKYVDRAAVTANRYFPLSIRNNTQ